MTTKAIKTQELILETALKHFLKEGYAGASLRKIVKDAGLTTGAFYKYYPTKEKLFNALIDPYLEDIYKIYDEIIDQFEKLSADAQTNNMSYSAEYGLDCMIHYLYNHHDHFKLLFKCGDSGKYEEFIHNMVDRETKATYKYLETMRCAGMDIPEVSDLMMHMVYTGFFSSILQIIEHDIDKDTAIKILSQLREFQTGGWERVWGIKFPA